MTLSVGVAPGNSTGADDIIPGAIFPVILNADETNAAIANGVLDPAGLDTLPTYAGD